MIHVLVEVARNIRSVVVESKTGMKAFLKKGRPFWFSYGEK